jgi:hypothetical protein
LEARRNQREMDSIGHLATPRAHHHRRSRGPSSASAVGSVASSVFSGMTSFVSCVKQACVLLIITALRLGSELLKDEYGVNAAFFRTATRQSKEYAAEQAPDPASQYSFLSRPFSSVTHVCFPLLQCLP